MRRLFLAPTILLLATALAACSASATPGWTYSPPTPEPSASASAGASGEPSASASASAEPTESASAEPTGSASAEPSERASAEPSAGADDTVDITAVATTKFVETEVAVPADRDFTIHFDNQETGQIHNVEIKDAGGTSLFTGEFVTGPGTADYQVSALAAGEYEFLCSVHPTLMTGTMTAG